MLKTIDKGITLVNILTKNPERRDKDKNNPDVLPDETSDLFSSLSEKKDNNNVKTNLNNNIAASTPAMMNMFFNI